MNTQEFEFDMATVRSQAGELKLSRSQGYYFSENLGADCVLEMVAIPEGTFMMGSPDIEKEAYDSEKPEHQVAVKPFFMGKYPITQTQWQVVATMPKVELALNPNPSKYQGDNHPVERVSWYEAIEFCWRLSRLTGKHYRLPTEAEWEYACRSRTNSRFHFGRSLPKHLANCYGSQSKNRYPESTTPVGLFGVANAFGLYDMHGNVNEWCVDGWHEDYNDAPTNGSAWLDEVEAQERVIRGGFWLSYPRNCRSAYRDSYEPDSRSSVIGFRVVCETENSLFGSRK
ncbi:formylglycine-generating enzyme family protein [Candidatus Gracilibacteria bacterium]|nr:formylglycine-generating enzyme family protein [Candidatus Gracilibacteria bacterium]